MNKGKYIVPFLFVIDTFGGFYINLFGALMHSPYGGVSTEHHWWQQTWSLIKLGCQRRDGEWMLSLWDGALVISVGGEYAHLSVWAGENDLLTWLKAAA